MDTNYNETAIKSVGFCLPVFQQRWWIEIAQGKASYRAAIVRKNGDIVGILPYCVSRNRAFMLLGRAPYWSHLGGPAVSQALSDKEKAEVFCGLIEQLPRTISFQIVCGPEAKDADLIRKAFKDTAFLHTTQATYIETLKDPDIMSRLTPKHQGHIRRARKILNVIGLTAEEFISFYQTNLDEAGKKSHSPLNVARDLVAKGQGRRPPQVRVFAARRKKESPEDPDPPLDAAIACAWDDERYYLWMLTRRRYSTDSPHKKPHGDATKLLIAEAINHAREMRLTFDADGVTTPGTEQLYRDNLRMPHKQYRDVFDRPTTLYQLFQKYRRQFERFVAAFDIPRGCRRLRLFCRYSHAHARFSSRSPPHLPASEDSRVS